MIGTLYFSDLILLVTVVLIVVLIRVSHTSMIFNINIILLMILVVVTSIFTFVMYYIDGDVSVDNFKLLKVLFLSLMVFMLVSFGVVIFIGWEGIGVISICLIGYWIRPMAKSGAMSAMMYNR